MLADGLASENLAEPRTQPPGLPVVFWVGRMIPRKSPVLAVEAFAHLRRAMPARLVMAGDGPLRGQVRAAIDRLGLAADVDLLGHVSLAEIKQLYDSASVLLFTSLRESFGAPFLEALGRGLPTVALDLHGIADADVGDAAVKVPLPPDPRDLAGHIGAGAADDTVRRRMGVAQRGRGQVGQAAGYGKLRRPPLPRSTRRSRAPGAELGLANWIRGSCCPRPGPRAPPATEPA